jgi:hypothetical protein
LRVAQAQATWRSNGSWVFGNSPPALPWVNKRTFTASGRGPKFRSWQRMRRRPGRDGAHGRTGRCSCTGGRLPALWRSNEGCPKRSPTRPDNGSGTSPRMRQMPPHGFGRGARPKRVGEIVYEPTSRGQAWRGARYARGSIFTDKSTARVTTHRTAAPITMLSIVTL